MKEKIAELNKQFEGATPQEVLAWFVEHYRGKIGLASSGSIEDQALTAMLCGVGEAGRDFRIFTLDTGRLFPETYSTLARTNEQFGIKVEVFFPDRTAVEEMVNTDGINLFYESIEKRKKCCSVRKIEPLKRAFKGLDAWVCGLRREQSPTRAAMQVVEWDEANQMLKINPLIEWSEQQTWEYIKQNGIPYNKLHDQGFPSIGCQPCTRAVEAGEDIRAGRWWWEDPMQKECGLHKK